ncbi:MAG: hypothetical protein DRN65_01560 [Thaumarchaeota archaeon]|nr:MAG: hypothetical protein DRN65_01560 [Nitrososphaerota archaeon]
MSRRTLSITKEIIDLLLKPEVIGLATHRHLQHERAIYLKHGRCGFAIDVLVREGGERKLYSILVEAEVKRTKRKFKSFMELGGTVRYQLSQKIGDTFKIKRRKLTYRNGEELFHQVDLVRSAFYEKYRQLKAAEGIEPSRIDEEIFHAAGISPDEMLLGV